MSPTKALVYFAFMALLVTTTICYVFTFFLTPLANGTLTQVLGSSTDSAPAREAGTPARTATSTPGDNALIQAGLASAEGVIDAAAMSRLLEEIPADVTADAAPYERDQFGQRWADVDRNGCDTRNDLLARDLSAVVFKPGTRDCVVISGELNDPYSGQALEFTRGEGTSDLVPIDHVIPLAWAWQNGADSWDAGTREAFANDPLNLQATTREQNTAKSDRGPSEWMPAAADYHCAYIARFVLVAATYDLTMPADDRAAAANIIDWCQPAPATN